MARVALDAQAVRVRRSLGREQVLYYEELAGAAAEDRHLCLTLTDGSALRVAVGAGEAKSLAAQVEAVVGATAPVPEALDPLREALRIRQAPAGFAAAPYVDLLLGSATALGASDLHLLPNGDAHHVSIRLDGMLHDLDRLPAARAARVVGRLKVVSGTMAHRRDVPQEGRAEVYDGWVRLSFAPAVGGEAVTVRLFDQLKGAAALDDLGFDARLRAGLSSLLAAPSGVLLVAGPSASGKTTTMYTALRHLLAGGSLRAVTVEDPVEYRVPGVVQLEARDDLRGAALLRAALRHDADVLVVGEARDPESVELMLRAGLTGHRVLATVHAGSAPEALVRLAEAGAPPTLLGTAVTGVLAQRLLRRRCCAAGCPSCHGTGYAGRVAVGEVLRMDDSVRGALGLDVAAIAAAAQVRPMRAAATDLAEMGVTDAAEVARVLGAER